MKKHLCVLILLLSSVGTLLANDPTEEIIIKQPDAMKMLYAVSAADPQGPKLDIASIFVASMKTTMADGVVLEPGLFIQEGEHILDGRLSYTGIEPILLYVQSEKGIESFHVFPGEQIAVGSSAAPSDLYCDYCRCICTRNDQNPAKTTNIGIGPLPLGPNYAYFTWNGGTSCTRRNGEDCETKGGFNGTLSGCKKVSRKCL